MLKRLYNLSDEQMEYQLLDRMSYKRFCGLANATNVPDRTTVWTFENRIGEAGAKALFDGVSAQLLKRGFIARGGQIIDATLVPAPKQHNRRGEKELIEQGAMPASWRPAKRRQKDLDATWTRKHGKSHFDYKLSINVDKKYKIIRRLETDTARTHDSQHFGSYRVSGDDRARLRSGVVQRDHGDGRDLRDDLSARGDQRLCHQFDRARHSAGQGLFGSDAVRGGRCGQAAFPVLSLWLPHLIA